MSRIQENSVWEDKKKLRAENIDINGVWQPVTYEEEGVKKFPRNFHDLINDCLLIRDKEYSMMQAEELKKCLSYSMV